MKGQNLIIRCIVSLSQAFFKQYRIKNVWSPREFFLKACERERKREKYKKKTEKEIKNLIIVMIKPFQSSPEGEVFLVNTKKVFLRHIIGV